MASFPPKKYHRFLRWFCKEEYLEEFEGDFIELFEETYSHSPRRARAGFRWNVLRTFRYPFIKTPGLINASIAGMATNHAKMGWRTLKGHPFFTLLNAVGLAIGLAGFMYIALFVFDELSYDRMFPDADRIYRLNIDNKTAGEVARYASSPGPLADAIKSDYAHAELVTRFRGISSILVRPLNETQNIKEEKVVGADSSFFAMFGLPLLEGEPPTALSEPKSLVITKTAAAKYFGHKSALGQTMVLDDDQHYKISGVIDDLPQNSFLRGYHFFISINSFEDAQSPAWNNWNFPTFVKLKTGTEESDFQHFLDAVKERYLIPWAMTFIPGLTIESSREADAATGNYMNFGKIALTKIHLHSIDREEEFNATSHIQNIYILCLIGCILLILAVVNFVNLSTAQALKRSKEVGVRKTLGSSRSTLIWQFLSEATLISFIALLFAIGILVMALPLLNHISDKHLMIPLQEPFFWLGFLGAGCFLGLLCGFYPSVILSHFRPVRILSGEQDLSMGGAKIRQYLLLFQFGISAVLIIATLVIHQQLNFMRSKDLGYAKEQVLVLDDVDVAGGKLEILRQEILQLEQVVDVSLSSYLPTPSARNGVTLFREGKVLDPEGALIIGQWDIDYGYVPTLSLDIIAGRNFDREHGQDSNNILLNETAVSMLGLTPDEAIGLRLTSDFHRDDKENMSFSTVVGVIKNFHFETLRNRIDGLSFTLGGSPNKLMARLLSPDFTQAIQAIESIWNEVAPGQPFDYYFMDDSFEQTYHTERRLSSIFLIFALLSIFVACLGLFGLAAYNAESKIKEIGIRKVLGASAGDIAAQLSLGFLKLVLLANLIAIPLGWYVMQKWLQNYSFRIEIPWWTLGISVVLVLLVAMLTVGFQAVRAYIMNPIQSLRRE